MRFYKNKADTIELSESPETAGQGKFFNRSIPLTHSIPAKVGAFFLVVIMSIVTVACIAGVIIMSQYDMYTTPKSEALYNAYNRIAYEDVEKITRYIRDDLRLFAEKYCSEKNIYYVKVTDKDSEKVIWKYTNSIEPENTVVFDITDGFYSGDNYFNFDVKFSVYEQPIVNDNYMLAHNIVDFFYAMLYWIYVITILAFICGVVSFVFLMCASGHKKGYSDIKPGWGTKIPFDLLTAIVAVVMFCLIRFLFESNFHLTGIMSLVLIVIIIGMIIPIVLTGWTMSLAVRIKLGEWWKNTVVFRILRLLWRGIKALFGLLSKIPLVWKTAIIVAGASLAELILMVCSWNDYGKLMWLWYLSSVVLGIAVISVAVMLKKLQKGGEALANGDLSCHIDTTKLFGDLKKHGENLNNIGKGLTIAVEERLKSERLKTELITNVSHDIKTPLTSIINYTDLITKEPCSNEKITEYSQVLLRQSERLKRLIEDLVEASKASTGNLEVLLAPCEANILLTQAVGEYEEKLQSKNLELITTQPDVPVMIMADGRRLWRIFDNLINNICKYAQSNTRVYLSLERQGDEAVITFKNTSHAPLNMTAEELMERFVRGDSSRHTEGSGLGLSIARSLTELQNGTLEISIDGDLFKATLRFPIIK